MCVLCVVSKLLLFFTFLRVFVHTRAAMLLLTAVSSLIFLRHFEKLGDFYTAFLNVLRDIFVYDDFAM